eukprot:CAMPEP_0202837254 /NCGR_PEP_ID=MMETSP1389-20130828/45156_1 /ASSEMBLY_ACC=CAM_ASM_000865 /TAXON_ID=302021 /ORGANISM="Rhodomonas sp., Strain CCMP768" /LENGTH=177 /DNA_ID=CAMNT_0049513283 /DNA_START=6 /DNA_END=539 /DNA_ORIENTATION=+
MSTVAESFFRQELRAVNKKRRSQANFQKSTKKLFEGIEELKSLVDDFVCEATGANPAKAVPTSVPTSRFFLNDSPSQPRSNSAKLMESSLHSITSQNGNECGFADHFDLGSLADFESSVTPPRKSASRAQKSLGVSCETVTKSGFGDICSLRSGNDMPTASMDSPSNSQKLSLTQQA